jgi:hypothetical protein
MNWIRAIEINQAALIRIVAELMAMAGLGEAGVVTRLHQSAYEAIVQVLRPAESAVRRLIVVAAKGMVLEPARARAMAETPGNSGNPGKIARTPADRSKGNAKNGVRLSFKLFDTRKDFTRDQSAQAAFTRRLPRIHVFDFDPRVPLFHPKPTPPEPGPTAIEATRLCRRITAMKMALEDLPKQARRLLRWQARRKAIEKPVFTDPLRPGRPPGSRKRQRFEIDKVLTECHALARMAQNEDTS